MVKLGEIRLFAPGWGFKSPLSTLSWSDPPPQTLMLAPSSNSHPIPHVPTSDDDIVFEDFARQRLKGMKDDKEDEEERTNSPQLNDR